MLNFTRALYLHMHTGTCTHIYIRLAIIFATRHSPLVHIVFDHFFMSSQIELKITYRLAVNAKAREQQQPVYTHTPTYGIT